MLRPAPALPHEVLSRCFKLVTADGQTFGGSASGSSESDVQWSTSEAAVPLALVCRAYYWPAQQELYRSVILTSSSAAKAFSESLAARPAFKSFTQNLVVGISGDDDVEGDDGADLETSHRMVKAIEMCSQLHRLHVLPLHAIVKDSLASVLRDKALWVAVWAAPTSAAGVRLRWGEALLLPTELVLPSLWYLEVHARPRPQIVAASSPALRTTAPRNIPTPPFATPLAHIAPLMKIVKLHFDIDADALHRLLSRCPALSTLDIYLERVYSPPELALVTAALEKMGPAIKFIYWITNAGLDEASPSLPLFNAKVLGALSNLQTLVATATDVHPEVLRHLPATLELLELLSFEEPGVYGVAPHLLDALADEQVELGALQRLIVHDVLSWWEEEQLEIMAQACSDRRVEFIFVDDESEKLEDEVRRWRSRPRVRRRTDRSLTQD